MGDYIEREELLEELCAENCGCVYPGKACENCRTAALVESIPAADVVPVVHGAWVFKFVGPHKRMEGYCSVCGQESGFWGGREKQEKPFCPSCGAKMDGEP